MGYEDFDVEQLLGRTIFSAEHSLATDGQAEVVLIVHLQLLHHNSCPFANSGKFRRGKLCDDTSRSDMKSLVSLDPEGRSSLPKFLVILRAKMDTVGPSVGDVVKRLEVKCRCGKSFRFDPRNSNT